MNNTKVRIYELSRELNLDNRDILAVCDQLNIAVKSHSSTITEAEAAQIRAAAETYTPNHSSPGKPPVAASQASPNARKPSPQPPVKKQQILEIRRHRPAIVEPPKRPEALTTPPSAEASPPPSLSTAPPPTTKLSSPPSRAKAPEQVEEEPKVSPAAKESEESAAPEVAALRPPEPVAEPQEEEEAPELIAPPSRPTRARIAAPSSSEGTPLPLSNRPIIKRAKPQDRSETPPPSREQGERRLQVKIMDADEPVALKPKPVPELRRPRPRPDAAADAAASTSSKSEPDDVLGADDPDKALADGPKLRRPTAPRPPKRGKAWEEEEEEQESPPKAGKVTRAKRRLQPVLDEDEDDDLADGSENGAVTPVQVSLSLARPPKPKGRPGQVKPPASATPPQRGRRGSGGRDSAAQRRDRREQEQKVDRPEELVLTDSLTVHDLADALAVPETDIIKLLFFKGIAANINQVLDIPTARIVAEEMGVSVSEAEAEAEAKKITEMLDASDLESLQRRPPVVTIMGHVDHGKTTLLDSIRKTKVAQGEAGGITQHIGAYHVDVEHEGKPMQVVFLDTPGHEAFTAMRARGARVTDIAVLVVAADDGVRPQTIEAISHAKAAEVPIVVAINKIDKEGAQPDRVKQEMTEYGLVPEEWGGDTVMVPVSAINGENLDTLLEMILLVSEVEDLYANPDRLAKGTVIEANLDKARGPVATLLIQNGTLRVGDVLVAGSAFGKVRAMIDDRGKRVEAAGPSFAVEVLGLSDVPAAGDDFEVFADEKEARSVAEGRSEQLRQSRLQQAMASRRVSLTSLSAQAQEGELKELNLILKADVQGSVEAILGSLQQLPQREVQVRVLLAAPGEITETDVDLASASDAVIVGFNTTLASGARQAADQAGIDVRDYNVIYKLLEDIQGAMEGLLEPEMVEEPLGQVEVRAVFPVGRGAVAGCYVQSGKAVRNCRIRVRRGSEVVFEGGLDSLKRMKENVKEVNAGYECGIGIDNFSTWKEGDIIETFRMVSKRRTLSA